MFVTQTKRTFSHLGSAKIGRTPRLPKYEQTSWVVGCVPFHWIDMHRYMLQGYLSRKKFSVNSSVIKECDDRNKAVTKNLVPPLGRLSFSILFLTFQWIDHVIYNCGSRCGSYFSSFMLLWWLRYLRVQAEEANNRKSGGTWEGRFRRLLTKPHTVINYTSKALFVFCFRRMAISNHMKRASTDQ